jgi:hypothetical protein
MYIYQQNLLVFSSWTINMMEEVDWYLESKICNWLCFLCKYIDIYRKIKCYWFQHRIEKNYDYKDIFFLLLCIFHSHINNPSFFCSGQISSIIQLTTPSTIVFFSSQYIWYKVTATIPFFCRNAWRTCRAGLDACAMCAMASGLKILKAST